MSVIGISWRIGSELTTNHRFDYRFFIKSGPMGNLELHPCRQQYLLITSKAQRERWEKEFGDKLVEIE